MKIRVRFPGDEIREVEVTAWRDGEFSPPTPDIHAMFPNHVCSMTLGPDQDEVSFFVHRERR